MGSQRHWARWEVIPCVLASVLLQVSLIHAQPEPRPEPEDPYDDTTTATDDEAWRLYDRAFEQLVAGDRMAARKLLVAVTEKFADHPAAVRAVRRIAEIDTAAREGVELSAEPADASDAKPADTPDPKSVAEASKESAEKLADMPTDPTDSALPGPADDPTTLARSESPSALARGELAFNMTAHGVILGATLREMTDGQSSRSLAASLLAGGGTGLGLSLYFGQRGITPGQAQLLNSAAAWGLWNSGLTRDDVLPESGGESAATAAMQLAGLGAGLLLWPKWQPTSGDVSLTNTAGTWTTILVLLAHGAVGKTPGLNTTILAGDAGLLAGALLSRRYPMSRSRTLLIDAGGVLGGLFGSLLAVTGDAEEEGAFTVVLLGTAAGLLLATLTTRKWDPPASLPESSRIAITPMGTRGWGAALSFDL